MFRWLGRVLYILMINVAICLVENVLLFNPSPAYPLEKGKTWKYVNELTEDDLKFIDLRTDTPRDKEISYLPSERYPFSSPYTAEEMGYRAMEFPFIPRWSAIYYEVYVNINSNGNRNTDKGTFAGLYDEPGVEGQIYQTKPGEEYYRWYYYQFSPAEFQNRQMLFIGYRTDQSFTKKYDLFDYEPTLRKVRRQPQVRREERRPNTAFTEDDSLGRDAWEFAWKFIGTDTLYQTIRFPRTRKSIRLLKPDGSYSDIDTGTLKVMGEEYPYYTREGGVQCYVVEAKPRKEWLPNYYCGKIIYWLEGHFFYPLRTEQYDQKGNLFFIEERMARLDNPGIGDKGYAPLIILSWYLKENLMSYDLQDGRQNKNWSKAEQKTIFTSEFMRREQPPSLLQSYGEEKSPEEFYLRPLLYEEKFPEERTIEISEKLRERIEAEEKVGHLIFD